VVQKAILPTPSITTIPVDPSAEVAGAWSFQEAVQLVAGDNPEQQHGPIYFSVGTSALTSKECR